MKAGHRKARVPSAISRGPEHADAIAQEAILELASMNGMVPLGENRALFRQDGDMAEIATNSFPVTLFSKIDSFAAGVGCQPPGRLDGAKGNFSAALEFPGACVFAHFLDESRQDIMPQPGEHVFDFRGT